MKIGQVCKISALHPGCRLHDAISEFLVIEQHETSSYRVVDLTFAKLVEMDRDCRCTITGIHSTDEGFLYYAKINYANLRKFLLRWYSRSKELVGSEVFSVSQNCIQRIFDLRQLELLELKMINLMVLPEHREKLQNFVTNCIELEKYDYYVMLE